ncbi:MAG: tRNA threonylcarbamoyladenosine dehydratase [Erysipelotrichaceae bacterium]|nr:tRNA threonylcarbamoyladenosine dehydratase [Erysipelotrichaceae bacterium]MDY5251774.1 tRNA threonylcarbamoyladenosine dehydratase [Erysipelotrichaceae bacterium]
MEEFERTRLLIGDEALAKLRQSKVVVVGCGGVGSYAIEGLARSGIGKLVIVDKDVVNITNLNRQLMSGYDNIDQSKVEQMKKRILTYAHCEVECVERFFDDSCQDILAGADFVIDAIDTMSSKLALAKMCHTLKIPFVMSLGMANRLDPSQLEYTTLDKTSYDPVAKILRSMCKKEGIRFKIPVIFSREIPHRHMVMEKAGENRKERFPLASMVFVPASAGLLAASVCVRHIIDK